MRKLLCAAAMMALAATSSNAATLTGDNVTVSYNGGEYVGSGVVGAGNDVQIGGGFHDLDAGVNGDVYQLSWDAGFSGLVYCDGRPATITLSNLNFSGGAVLAGFTLLTSIFANTSISIGANSVTITFTEGGGGPGVVLSGQFVTRPNEVPLPAALPLLAAGLGALGVVGWRRKKA